MKTFIVFALLVAVAAAASVETEVLKNIYSQGENTYNFAYELSDKQTREETGELKAIKDDDPGSSVKGSFSFVADDGQTYTINYIADENGFQPSGAHIPVVPVV